ncbi:aldo/keto reductase [Azohydromonas caseinilytica]|uniref:L-glyceraldehyde 3-phosphate reductase n=1 Tax=Azohydromonas caseinilytica TaxID=2728836 RepID=A0A848FIP9_9BURK|nr:aldo/keto reductase [Azohydromonas caseinilytica]NML18070.1 L-glyceraldehyde 3-phosphate reductase [Azohydromonas caseinilytica]
MDYRPASTRYDAMPCRRCGHSGLKLPAVSLGLWHNFGEVDRFDNARALVRHAFDLGITHFDLANNYGPPPGSAERTMGEILRRDLAAHRDELIISTKAGYRMGPGPHGDGGSRKYLLSSLDQSLRRLGLEYVDIFYHHRPDPETPLAETMGALDHAVRSGRALYVGLSNYPPALLREAAALLRGLGTPCVIHQPRYSLFDRRIEQGLLDALAQEGVGCIAYSPLAQGLLSNRYLDGAIPADSRAARGAFLTPQDVTAQRLAVVRQLDELARSRGQTLAQLALAWVLRHAGMSSVLIGASRVAQIDDAVGALRGLAFNADELATIERMLGGLEPV